MKKAPSLSICNNPELSTKNRRKKQKVDGGWYYGIERLPDEILIFILSCLTLKEAARTSVLGHRWRYIWCYTSGSLDFDTKNYQWFSDSFGLKVDQILKLHRSPSVDKFIVRCPRRVFHDHITNWVHFAVKKNVKVFEVSSQKYDDFPELDNFLSISRAVKPKVINGLSSLTSLTLVHLKTEDQMVQFLLSNCPLLQHLCLSGLSGLKKLNVNVGSSLKSLIINYCHCLKDLTISAPNLVSFEYGGVFEWHIEFENVPLLSDLTVVEDSCSAFLYNKWRLKFSNQLEKLSMHFPSRVHAPAFYFDSFFPKLQCLKYLELVLDTVDPFSFLHFVLMIKTCPFLSTFVVQFVYKLASCEAQVLRNHFFPQHSRSKSELSRAEMLLKAHSNECLKVVKLMNMAFYRPEFRFALTLLQIARSLEKVIIEPCRENFGNKRIAIARERVKQLKAILPPGAKLIIL